MSYYNYAFPRLSSPVPHTSEARTCCAFGGKAVRRWNRETKQMVDVFPEEAVHEQESCHIECCKSTSMRCITGRLVTGLSSHFQRTLSRSTDSQSWIDASTHGSYFFLLLSLGFFFPVPIIGMSPSIPRFLIVLPFPPAPTLSISGTQSGSIQLLTTVPPSPLLDTAPFNILFSSLSLFPSASFLARIQAV